MTATATAATMPVPAGLAEAFATVLDYPHSPPLEAARACAALAREESEDAGGLLDGFVAALEASPLGELQEAYTRTFDLDTLSRSEPTAYPYAGHYLFEETHKRGMFILGLRRRFREHGFEQAGELDDHLVVLLRFLGVCADAELAGELIDDAMLPALVKMLAGSEPDSSLRGAYLDVLRALELTLRTVRPGAAPDPGEAEREWLRYGDSLGIQRSGHGH